MRILNPHLVFFFCISVALLVSCQSKKPNQLNNNQKPVPSHEISRFNRDVSIRIDSLIQHQYLSTDQEISCGSHVYQFYQLRSNEPAWSDSGKFKPAAHQFLNFLDSALYCGLDPEAYHHKVLQDLIKKIKSEKANPAQWAQCELLLTDAFMHVTGDVKQGRLVEDSLQWIHLSARLNDLFLPSINHYLADPNINAFIRTLEPSFHPYQQLRSGIKKFVQQMDTGVYTRLKYPYAASDSLDSLRFILSLHQRLQEAKPLQFTFDELLDSSALSAVIQKYQSLNGLVPDGKISRTLVAHLNLTDQERLKRVFISLDRYKKIADSLPEHFIWVNLPSFKLKIYRHDTISFSSNIVCGKSSTATPLLTSHLDEMVIFPTWTVPPGIIKKEMIPGLKKNNNYLSRKGLKLYDQEGKLVDPKGVDWTKYTRGIPYKIVQGSGERNALGVMKFNFANPYFVYMHDTNQRGFFKKDKRALSHGCVRVEEWKALAHYIALNDSLSRKENDTLKYNCDSIDRWIDVKRSRRIRVKYPIKLFFEYITCEADSGKIRFYDDIYGEDKKMLDKYYSSSKK